MNPATIRNMSDRELLSRAQVEQDPLTTTALEVELLARFESLLNAVEGDGVTVVDLDAYGIARDELERLLESHPADTAAMAELLTTLSDEDITDAQDLSDRLAMVDLLFREGIQTMAGLTELIENANQLA